MQHMCYIRRAVDVYLCTLYTWAEAPGASRSLWSRDRVSAFIGSLDSLMLVHYNVVRCTQSFCTLVYCVPPEIPGRVPATWMDTRPSGDPRQSAVTMPMQRHKERSTHANKSPNSWT